MITKRPRAQSEESAEINLLRQQLREANDTLRAIRQGEIDALVVEGPAGNQIYTLQTADHPYRVLVQQMNEGALILSTEGFVLYANATFSNLLSVSFEELISAPVQPLVIPEHRQLLQTALASAAAGQAVRTEMSLLSRTGERIPVLLSLGPLNLEIMQGVCGIVTDLRESAKAEELERSQLLVRSILDHATAAVLITDRAGRIAHANYAAERLAGRNAQGGPNASILPEPFLKVFPLQIEASASSEVPGSAGGLLEAAMAGSVYRSVAARLQNKAGGKVDLLVSAGPFRPGAGEIQGAVFTFSDVTALREAQRSLRQSEQRFRDLAESIPQFVWTTDAEGRLDYCNSRMLEYFGKTLEDLVREPYAYLHPDDAAECRLAWLGALETKNPFEMECRMLGKDGSYHWFLNRALPIRGEKWVHWFGTGTNVDAQKYVEKELRRANSDLEQFAYAASHDFQEPLRAVTVYSQLLERSRARGSDADVPLYLRYILEGADRLGALVQNLLAYMAANRDYETTPGAVDCNDVLREVLASLQLSIEQVGAQITAEALPTVHFARVHMVQLFQNLISNAIKYRGPEPLRVIIAAEDRGEHWLFSFRDNGIGIAPEHQHTIFGVFKRLHGSEIPGTGIGLAICQRLLDQYGGKIWVESELDKGSTFYFSVPVAVAGKAHGEVA